MDIQSPLVNVRVHYHVFPSIVNRLFHYFPIYFRARIHRKSHGPFGSRAESVNRIGKVAESESVGLGTYAPTQNLPARPMPAATLSGARPSEGAG